MTDPMLTAGVRRVAADLYPHDWQERVLVANIASILDLRGYSVVGDVPAHELDQLFADNTFGVAVCDPCWDSGVMFCEHPDQVPPHGVAS